MPKDELWNVVGEVSWVAGTPDNLTTPLEDDLCSWWLEKDELVEERDGDMPTLIIGDDNWDPLAKGCDTMFEVLAKEMLAAGRETTWEDWGNKEQDEDTGSWIYWCGLLIICLPIGWAVWWE